MLRSVLDYMCESSRVPTGGGMKSIFSTEVF